MLEFFEKYQLIIFDWEGTLAYSEQNNDVLYPDAFNLINFLWSEKKKLAIATGKRRESLENSLQNFEMSKYFSVVCSASDFQAKPAPDMLLHALDTTGITKKYAIMVGDSLVDIIAANAAGIDSCYINRYAIEHDVHPKYEVRNLIFERD